MSEKEEKKVQDAVENKVEAAEEKVETVEDNKEELVEQKAETDNKEEPTQEKIEQKSEVKKEKKSINALKIFYKPAEAIKTAVTNNYWKSGLIFLLIYFLVVGVLSAFQVVQVRMISYNASIEYFEERLDQAEDNYRERGTTYYRNQVENYKERLSEAKKNRFSIFKDIELYLSMMKNFVVSLVSAIIRVLLLILLLFVIGKILTKQGSFSQIVAGVGTSINVYYVSLIVLPLLAKLPLLGSVTVLSSVVTAFLFVLLYFVFKYTFEADEDHSAIGAVLSMAIMLLITAFVSDGITFVSEIIEKIFA